MFFASSALALVKKSRYRTSWGSCRFHCKASTWHKAFKFSVPRNKCCFRHTWPALAQDKPTQGHLVTLLPRSPFPAFQSTCCLPQPWTKHITATEQHGLLSYLPAASAVLPPDTPVLSWLEWHRRWCGPGSGRERVPCVQQPSPTRSRLQ